MNTEHISVQSLTNGEKIALGGFEILSIPHISIIAPNTPANEIVSRYKAEFAGLLNEVYQAYRTLSMAAGVSKDIAFDLLWTTHPVENQPFNASIRLFILVRVIDASAEAAVAAVGSMLGLFSSALSLQKYDFEALDAAVLTRVVAGVSGQAVCALVKEEKAVNLQNGLFPYCYAYDRFPVSDGDLSRLVSVLTEYPGCAVSMQLMPTVFTDAESMELDRVTQALETLRRGVSDQSLGSVSFALAEKHAQDYKDYAGHKNAPLFMFNVLVFAPNEAVSGVSGRLFGQLSSGGEGSAELKLVSLSPAQVNKDGNLYPLPWAVSELLINTDRNYQIWASGQFSQAAYRLPYVITAGEAAEFFRLPVGSERISAGIRINDAGKDKKTYAAPIINAGDIEVGRLRASSKGDTIGFSLKDLAKHMLVVGTPGSGKTTFSVSLLDRLWKQHGIPFLVIEPAKNEYRALVQSIPDLQVFTPGKNFISPFVFNPFVPPKNVKLETYKSTLKTAFAAAVSMSTPLDKIFEESINNCYSDFRWLDSYTSDDRGRTFNISDFIKCFRQTFDEIGYTGDAKNIGRAGVVRLNSLVNLFDNYHSIPIEDLLQKPTVIELAAIENADQKALIISLLLLSILAYVNANYVGEGGLKNVILLEEAHVLLDAETNGGQGEANPSGIAQNLVKRMLAEIRSYGVGLIIADQSPRKVSTDVVALTDMKMVFRLVENADKQIIGNSTNMTEAQIQRMGRLRPGEAFLFFNKLDAPEEVITPDYRLQNNIGVTLSDEGIRSLSTYWNTRKSFLRPYPQCLYSKACAETCDFSRRMLAKEIARRIYKRFFTPSETSFEPVKQVFGHIWALTAEELDGLPRTPELVTCVKVHLWRKIRYETNIPVPDQLIENSLKK